MSKPTDLFDVFSFITTYFVNGVIPFLMFVVFGMYVKGYFDFKAIAKAEALNKFSVKRFNFNPSLIFFKGVNKFMDVIIGSVLSALVKHFHNPLMNFLDKILPDSNLEKLLSVYFGKKSGVESLTFKSRVEKAKQEFDKKDNAFWWNKERAPDYRDISSVISGRWFNGQPVEKYLHFLISPRSFYQVVKSGILVFLVSFAVLCAVYHPEKTFGYTRDRVLIENIANLVKSEAVWSSHPPMSQSEKEDKAYEMVVSASGYNSSPIGYVFLGGYLTKLILALAIALIYINKCLHYNFKQLKIPFIKDSAEEYGFQNNINAIDNYKRNLSASNLRATGFDRVSPLICSFYSTGSQEKKNQIGAKRKGAPVMQSLLDKSQNTSIQGATGTGKTRSALIPEATAFFELKNMYYEFEKQYEDIFDLRRDCLTDKAIEEGYLKKFRKLPPNPISIAMTIMDIKTALWKDLRPVAERFHLQNDFIIIGADQEMGEFSVDLLKNLDPDKLISFLESIKSQMGSEDKKDFWQTSSLQWIKRFADVAYLFARTTGGRDYMQDTGIKIWSLNFIQSLIVYDSGAWLLSKALASIYEDIETCPERLSDIFNLERVRSIGLILNEWKNMSEGQRDGIQATMTGIVAGFDNTKLAPFMTGVGENMVEVGEFWGKITAFNTDTDRYGSAGKLILLFVKTLIFEEAVKRQIRYSRKVVEASTVFRNAYPNILKLETCVELIPLDWMTSEGKTLTNKFLDLCQAIQAAEGQEWKAGEYCFKLNQIVANSAGKDDDFGVVAQALEALSLAKNILKVEARHAEQHVAVSNLDPHMFDAVEGDSLEVAKQKEEHMALYYEYEDARTRVAREHMLFMGDEYQELITVDKSGGCYCDSNFPNISRSTNFKYFVATQTYNAYFNKVGKEVTENFMNQMRSQIYLATEDKATRDIVVGLAGTAEIFKNPFQNQILKNDLQETGYVIYDSFNAYISEVVEKNKNSPQQPDTKYPYSYDIFSKGEPIDYRFEKTMFQSVFSNIFEEKTDFGIPSMKGHFLDTGKVLDYRRTGSDSQGTNDNKDNLQQAWSEAREKMNTNYTQFLTQNYQKDTPLLSDNDFKDQGNIHTFVIVQRAGMTIKDHVIVAQEEDYLP